MTLLTQFNILNSFTDSISIIEQNGRILFTNNAWKRFSNENSGDLIKTSEGVNYLDVCKSVVGPIQLIALEAVSGILRVINYELDIFEIEYPCHSEIERRWFILRATPLEGFRNLTLLTHINITKRKLSEEVVDKKNNQLNEINSRLKSSVYKIVHDIQGPINNVQSLINLTKSQKDTNETKQFLSLIDNSVLKLKEFIQETLKMITSHQKDEIIDFKTMLSEFYESVKYLEVIKRVDVKFDIQQNHEHINNKSEILTIVSNLINNSLKYHDPEKDKSEVIVSVATSPHEARISISDNGIGISQELISKVFELNFQIRKDTQEGVGLGLFMVAKSVDFLNGKLDIESKLGVGTTIKIILPNKSSSK